LNRRNTNTKIRKISTSFSNISPNWPFLGRRNIYKSNVKAENVAGFAIFRKIGRPIPQVLSQPDNPGPGNDDLEGGVLAMDIARGFIFVGGNKGRIFHKTVV